MGIAAKILMMLLHIKKEYAQKVHFFCRPMAIFCASAMYMKQLGKAKHKAVLKELSKYIDGTVSKFSNTHFDNNETIKEDCPIWIMWWQGEDAMPPIVRRCYRSVLDNKGEHKVIFLDKNNYQQYVRLAPLIVEKIERNGWIAYLSDLTRFYLLSRYGGIWLDATIFVSSRIGGFGQSLYSIRHQKGHPKFVLQGDKWSSFMIASTANHPVPTFVHDALCEYFSKNDYLIDYWLTDYIIATLYLNNDKLKQCFDKIPLDNPSCLNLLFQSNLMDNKRTREDILKENLFNKLDWRHNIVRGSILDYIIKH